MLQAEILTFNNKHLSDAEGAKGMNELRNDALKEIFKRLTVNN